MAECADRSPPQGKAPSGRSSCTATMLVRTSSGNTSVGHLSHSPNGFSTLHRPDVSFQVGGLVFPVHSLLLSVSSRFFTDFFTFMRGQARPEVISLDAVKCTALSAVSLSYYLDFIYSGVLPDCDEVPEEVELVRLAHFFGNVPLTSQLCDRLTGKLAGLGEAELLEVFRAASDLKLRRLVTDCLVLLLPQFGHGPSERTVAAAIEHMDATLSKAVLTQLAVQGNSTGISVPLPSASGSPTRSANGSGSEAGSEAGQEAGDLPSILPSPEGSSSAVSTPLKRSGSNDSAFAAAASQELDRMKAAFVEVLESKGWGQ